MCILYMPTHLLSRTFFYFGHTWDAPEFRGALRGVFLSRIILCKSTKIFVNLLQLSPICRGVPEFAQIIPETPCGVKEQFGLRKTSLIPKNYDQPRKNFLTPVAFARKMARREDYAFLKNFAQTSKKYLTSSAYYCIIGALRLITFCSKASPPKTNKF